MCVCVCVYRCLGVAVGLIANHSTKQATMLHALLHNLVLNSCEPGKFPLMPVFLDQQIFYRLQMHSSFKCFFKFVRFMHLDFG